MLSLTHQVFAAALLLGIVGIYSPPLAQTQSTKKERTGSVSGRVTINGKAAPGVMVSIRRNESSNQLEPRYKDVTDEDGNYRITGVPAGNFEVAPLAPAFVQTDVNSLRSPGKSLLISEGEVVEGIDFALVRGGVITGRVSDAEGRPLIEQQINVIPTRPESQLGFWHFPRLVNMQTDDRGIYRIFGLPRGRYKGGCRAK